MTQSLQSVISLETALAAVGLGGALAGVYWAVRQWADVQQQRLRAEQLRLHMLRWSHRYDRLIPYKAQAYERLILFLERIAPDRLLDDESTGDEPAAVTRTRWILRIREEWLYNASQQLYVSPEAWQVVENAVEQTIMLINRTLQEIPSDARRHAFLGKFRENIMQLKTLPHQAAVDALKAEFRQFAES